MNCYFCWASIALILASRIALILTRRPRVIWHDGLLDLHHCTNVCSSICIKWWKVLWSHLQKPNKSFTHCLVSATMGFEPNVCRISRSWSNLTRCVALNTSAEPTSDKSKEESLRGAGGVWELINPFVWLTSCCSSICVIALNASVTCWHCFACVADPKFILKNHPIKLQPFIWEELSSFK